jgi:tetratricopeptide (TPR) repeat protein
VRKVLLIIIVLLAFNTEAQTSVLGVADSLYLNGNYTKSIEAYKKIQNQSQVYSKIANAYMALGNYDKALLNYKNSIEANPDNALLKYEYAKLLSKTKKYKEALNVFYQLIDIDYKNPNYHYESGLVLEKLKDSTAQNRFYSAFQLDSTHQKAIFRMVRFHVKKRHYKIANHYIDIGLKTYPNNKDLISLKAQNYYNKKNYDNAVVWFEKLIALNETSQFIHEKLSMSYAQIYEFEKAVKQGLLAIEYEPNNTNNLFIQGELYERIDDYENAEKYMLQSLLLQDQSLDKEYVKLASVYNRQRKYKKGIEVYKRAIEENPENERAQFLLIFTKDQYYKDVDTRIKIYEKFKNKFPESKFKDFIDYRITELKEEKFLKKD